ncbi:MAG TPA: CHAT domain-containing protein, partial [Candidatus Angelobacter sp.]
AFDVHFLEGYATRTAIREQFKSEKYDVLHLQAHGILGTSNRSSQLVLEDGEGKASFVDEGSLHEILESDTPPSLMTLIACHSAQQSRLMDPFSGVALSLIKQGAPAIIAMKRSIGIAAAEYFVHSFYSNLASSGIVDESINEARKMMHIDDVRSSEWAVPTLYMRLTDGRILSPKTEPAAVIDSRIPMPQTKSGAVSSTSQNAGFWNGLLQNLRASKLIPVIGPEINNGLFRSGPAIAKYWSDRYEYKKFNYPYIDRNDLPRIAKFVELRNGTNYPHTELLDLYKQDLLEREHLRDRQTFDRMGLEEVISKTSWRYFDKDPELPHVLLAKLLPIHRIITTNYDSFLRDAFLRERRQNIKVEACHWNTHQPDTKEYQTLVGSEDEALIFHAYGYQNDTLSMALTEDDYLDFTQRLAEGPWRLPQQLKAKLVTSMLLFLGYDVRDLDFRVFLKSVIASLRDIKLLQRVIVIQLDPAAEYRQKEDELNELQKLIQSDAQQLSLVVHWSSLRAFVGELWQRWNQQNQPRT